MQIKPDRLSKLDLETKTQLILRDLKKQGIMLHLKWEEVLLHLVQESLREFILKSYLRKIVPQCQVEQENHNIISLLLLTVNINLSLKNSDKPHLKSKKDLISIQGMTTKFSQEQALVQTEIKLSTLIRSLTIRSTTQENYLRIQSLSMSKMQKTN